MKKLSRFISVLLCVAMVLSLAVVTFAAEEDNRITSLSELKTGQYYIVCSNGINVGTLDGSWVIVGASVWTITVDGTKVKLTDANGVSIAPSGGNTNGIKSGDYDWTVSCDAEGMFTFAGQGSDTVKLASNVGSENKFRAYKTTTVSGNPTGYPSTFALYKADGGAPETPKPPVEPEVQLATIANGTYVVAFGSKAVSALAEDKDYGYLPVTEVTVTNGAVTGYTNGNLITITNVNGGFTMQDVYGRYFYMSGTYNNYNVSATVPAEGHIWQAQVAEGGVVIVNVLKGKTMAYDSSFGTVGAYADKSSVASVIAAAAIGEPEQPNEDQKAADAVIAKINAIGTVTKDSKAAIEAARTAYNALTDAQKKLVTNYETLTKAEADLKALEDQAAQDAADKAAADAVIAKINAIGTVTKDSKAAIEAARTAYNALTDAQKKLVTNYETLTKAEADFEALPSEPVNPPVDPEQPVDPTGDYTFVFFALLALSMSALVVLISKKRAF